MDAWIDDKEREAKQWLAAQALWECRLDQLRRTQRRRQLFDAEQAA